MQGYKQVTLIGGPGDLQRHVVSDIGRHFEIAEMPRSYPSYHDDLYADRPVVCIRHRYEIKQVGHKTYVGIHESLR